MGCNSGGEVDDSKFSNPLPWIGVYVAIASLALSLVMIGDIIRSLRYKCLWFPIKFCSLNATVLTLLTTSIKLSLDLNTPMPRPQDQLTKLSSMVLVCTVIGHSMPSIGGMQNQEIFMNITALGILVISLIVNICIQLGTGVIYAFWGEHVLVMFFMLVLLIILSLTATAVPTTKHYFKQKYSKQRQLILQERHGGNDRCTLQKAKEYLTKHRMMSFTSSPWAVIARSVTSSASAVICLVTALIFGEAMLRSFMMPGSIDFCHGESSYKWSTAIVLTTHTIAVAVGIVAPSSRYFMTITSSQLFSGRKKSFRDEVRVESYWIDKLLKWKQEPLALKFRSRLWRKFANEMKWRLLDICIRGQTTIVVISKVVSLVSVVCFHQILVCSCWCSKLETEFTHNGSSISRNESQSEPNSVTSQDFSDYILYLEGEEVLVKRMAKIACNIFAARVRKQQPAHLTQLLEKSICSLPFQQVERFSSYRIACLVLEESPGCWALPLVTLASIAVALPKVDHLRIQQLIHGVDEGFKYVRRVESKPYIEEDALNPRKAAEIVWLGVNLYNKWLDVGLSNMAKQRGSHKDVLEGLVHLAKGRLAEHKSKNTMPTEIIAVDSMHRICQIMLLDHERRNYQTSEELFQELSSIIAYIMGACLRSLPQVLLMECSVRSMETDPAHQRNALLLLCTIENILNFLQQKPLPTWDSSDEMAFVEHWQSSNDSSLQTQSSFSDECLERDLCLSV